MILFPKRGEIWLVCLDPTIGAEIKKTRPALIISNDIGNEFSLMVSLIPITDIGLKIYPMEVLLSGQECGLQENSKAKTQQIRTVDKKRLIKKLGVVSQECLLHVERAVQYHLGMLE